MTLEDLNLYTKRRLFVDTIGRTIVSKIFFFMYKKKNRQDIITCGVVKLNGNKGAAMAWNGAEIFSPGLFLILDPSE